MTAKTNTTTTTQIINIISRDLESRQLMTNSAALKRQNREAADQLVGEYTDKLNELCEVLTATFATLRQDGFFGSSEDRTPSGQPAQKGRMLSASRVFARAVERATAKRYTLKGYAPFRVVELSIVRKNADDLLAESLQSYGLQEEDINIVFQALNERLENIASRAAARRKEIKAAAAAADRQRKVVVLKDMILQARATGLPTTALERQLKKLQAGS